MGTTQLHTTIAPHLTGRPTKRRKEVPGDSRRGGVGSGLVTVRGKGGSKWMPRSILWKVLVWETFTMIELG